jgi:hypothetical protein
MSSLRFLFFPDWYFDYHLERNGLDLGGRSQEKKPLDVCGRRRKENVKINVKVSSLFA